MKKFKSGFTLAEVLITLAIIGVVAAIVMPSVVSSYQYKSIGTKLAKFASTTENAARAYVASNDSFIRTNSSVEDFLNESFIYKSVGSVTDFTASSSNSLKDSFNPQADNTGSVRAEIGSSVTNEGGGTPSTTNLNAALLKDNTYIQYSKPENAPTSPYTDSSKTGNGVFTLTFDPMVAGLPGAVQHTYLFVVTEMGYVFPATSDTCLDAIYNADWITTANMYKQGAKYTPGRTGSAISNACFKSTGGSTGGSTGDGTGSADS